MINEWKNAQTGVIVESNKKPGDDWAAIVPSFRFAKQGFSFYDQGGDWAEDANRQISDFVKFAAPGQGLIEIMFFLLLLVGIFLIVQMAAQYLGIISCPIGGCWDFSWLTDL